MRGRGWGWPDVYTIEVQNLDETIATLNAIDREAAGRLKSRIRTVVRPTLAKAKGYARVGSTPTGAYANSLALSTYRNGVKFVSTDPGAGTIEFAHMGAQILDGPRAGRHAPVPHTGQPPRALLRAVLEDEEAIVEDVNREVIEMCDFEIGV